MTTFSRFDAQDYLDNEAVIAEYLSAALEDPNPDVLLAALANVAKARGIAQLAKEAELILPAATKETEPADGLEQSVDPDDDTAEE